MGNRKFNTIFVVNKIVILILSLFVFIFYINFCFAANFANLENTFGGGDSPLEQVAGKDGAGYATEDIVSVEKIISTIITTALSFIGVIFLVLAIYGGYIWMIARGNEQEVEKAKQIIQNAVIGLVVVLAAYAISYYIISVLGAKTINTK